MVKKMLNDDNKIVQLLRKKFEEKGIPFSEKYIIHKIEVELTDQADKLVSGVIAGCTFSVLEDMINV